ncbi:MAG: four helix bundle protein [Wenzhouxiangella sp.]|jgi:carbamoyl-phosphate synthase large subunit|nr:four helix bundle protein [Wenzhouxiangella sp.]
MGVSHYRELVVWQRSMALVERIYQVTIDFGTDERFGLTAQLRRAAVSVPSNIAEGNARRSALDYARFVAMALGSLAEIETQLEIAVRLNLLNGEIADELLSECREIGKMLLSLDRRLRAYSASKVTDQAEWDETPLVPGP